MNTVPAASTAGAPRLIALVDVESSQIQAIGHDAETSTLAVRFKRWNGEPSSLYHYANFSAEDFAAFRSAESIGKHFGRYIKPFPEKYPFTRIESKPGVLA
ncbi:KTSC domain-containing protein [Pseudoxanthomonas winnipegensis]|uniref:KTSC domain-containing protein n=1 Tax=Pseudoxanthomonas winnipegensis TaxID=2480810 RepID=A0ABY1WCF3_9GAMM|nr:KTSC domain-containing protein [Pseudoxanthomonas winnipegensis]TAA11260.1 KTSC domain-containing protein [Pseudoxanthomonas winnipegensis]TAA18683.1 KTSC domain-containing protein [Pseudoxanthomonas winnipegensis]TAH73941.1 KTSC domain-containing protein [Pseudoxanthomonas winnipegensis]